ncbi:hypothetical protein U1Q18_024591 [Sarracenia purpurea var. burkii]
MIRIRLGRERTISLGVPQNVQIWEGFGGSHENSRSGQQSALSHDKAQNQPLNNNNKKTLQGAFTSVRFECRLVDGGDKLRQNLENGSDSLNKFADLSSLEVKTEDGRLSHGCDSLDLTAMAKSEPLSKKLSSEIQKSRRQRLCSDRRREVIGRRCQKWRRWVAALGWRADAWKSPFGGDKPAVASIPSRSTVSDYGDMYSGRRYHFSVGWTYISAGQIPSHNNRIGPEHWA